MKSIIIFTFMIKDLKLKGSELLLYALIYSFSQFGQYCFMKPESMADELGLSRSQVFRSLSSLIEKGYILSSSDGFLTRKNGDLDDHQEEQLQELIRILKTPWLDKRSNW